MPRTVIHLALIGLTLGLLASPRLAYSQTSTDTTGDQTTTPTPTPTTPTPTPTPVPTTGGTGQGIHPPLPLHATPGAWTAAGLSAAVARQNDILHGSATPTAPTTPARTAFLVSFLGNLFDNFNKFLVAALANSTLGNGLPGGTGSGTGPSIATRNGRVWGINQPKYEVIVTFADKVDQQSAETASNYMIGQVTASSAILDGTDTVVTLTFENAAFPFDSNLIVKLQNIKDSSGQTGQLNTDPILFNNDDNTRPTTTSISVGSQNTEVKVVFDEVMDKTSVETKANYLDTTNNQPPTNAVLGPDGLTLTLTFVNPVTGISLDLSIGNSLLDINELELTEKTVTVSAASQ